jgi:hypothetical protein
MSSSSSVYSSSSSVSRSLFAWFAYISIIICTNSSSTGTRIGSVSGSMTFSDPLDVGSRIHRLRGSVTREGATYTKMDLVFIAIGALHVGLAWPGIFG